MKRRQLSWLFISAAIMAQACSLATCPISQLRSQSATGTPRPINTLQEPTATPTATATTAASGLSAYDDPFLGPENAQVTMIGFSDYNCGYCRRFHVEILPALLDLYPTELRYVYRDFPIVGGGVVGYAAAQAANCAGEQNAYWKYHEALYSGLYGLNLGGYELIAKQLGLDSAAFLQCLESDRYADEVLQDWDEARSMGVTGTPTFFINGIPLIGAQALEVIAEIIDEELTR